MQGDVDRRGAGHLDTRDVAVVERLDDDDLVARVDQPHDGAKDRLGGARRDQHAVLRIDLHVVEGGGVAGDAFHQFRDAATRRVLVALAGTQGVNRGFDDFLRPVKVRSALTQIDSAMFEGEVVDFGENGRAKTGDAVGKARCRHGRSVKCANGG